MPWWAQRSAIQYQRFLLHVFPNGFVHIRYYGFMANRLRADKLALARRLIGPDTTTDLLLTETHTLSYAASLPQHSGYNPIR